MSRTEPLLATLSANTWVPRVMTFDDSEVDVFARYQSLIAYLGLFGWFLVVGRATNKTWRLNSWSDSNES
jgi:hypothetical protein